MAKSRDNRKKVDGVRLRTLRGRLGMTQRRLALEFYVSPGAIAHWENNKRPIPGPVKKLIELFEMLIESKESSNGKI